MFRVVELPQKHHLCKVKSLHKGDANSEVTVYYQVHTHYESSQSSQLAICTSSSQVPFQTTICSFPSLMFFLCLALSAEGFHLFYSLDLRT